VRHAIVHNKHVVDGLRGRGAVFVDDLSEVPEDSIVIFSAHGVAQAVREDATRRKIKVFDATCPLVTKVHMEVGHYQNQGRECILIGEAGHAEVQGTLGQYRRSDGADGSLARLAADRPATPNVITKLSVAVLQILGLWGLNLAGVWAVDATALPIPGNLLGMVALYGLLSLGVVKVSWFDPTGSFLIKHLAFFFVPITVGLMEWGRLLAQNGIGIVVTLITSAAIGIVLSGLVSQVLLGKPWRQGGNS